MTGWARAGRVARVFQDPMAGTCEDLTIEENMALAQRRGTFRNLGRAVKASMREGFRERLATLGLGLENRLTDRIGLLSGGQRQAVSLLMAALQPSRILLLDEHTAALDPRTADFVLRLTERIVAESQLTTMMVTHSMRQALDVGERTVMLHQGRWCSMCPAKNASAWMCPTCCTCSRKCAAKSCRTTRCCWAEAGAGRACLISN